MIPNQETPLNSTQRLVSINNQYYSQRKLVANFFSDTMNPTLLFLFLSIVALFMAGEAKVMDKGLILHYIDF